MRVSARLVVSGLALCLALLTAACHTQDRSAQAASAQAVSVVPAQMQTLSRSVPASGPVAVGAQQQCVLVLGGHAQGAGQGILCMVLGCVAIYGALFATGYWLYGQYGLASVTTVVALAAAVALAKAWPKLLQSPEDSSAKG